MDSAGNYGMCGRAVSLTVSAPFHTRTLLTLTVLAEVPIHVAKCQNMRHGPRPTFLGDADGFRQEQACADNRR